jgi:hypothetical protein
VLAVVILAAATERVARTGAEAQETAVFRPTIAVPERFEPFVKHVEPGNDAFPVERE